MNIIEKAKNAGNKIMGGISGIFMPLVNIMSGMGILKGLIALFVTLKILLPESGDYQVWLALSDAVYYFLPIMLAFTAAKQFGANPYTAAVIACVLLYPALGQAANAGTLSLFGLPVSGANYTYSVFPILLAVLMLKYAERLFLRILPSLLKEILTPVLCIIIVCMASILLLGPAGSAIGSYLALGYDYVYNFSPLLAGFFLSGLMQVFVIFGFHWSFVPIALNNLALTGYDTILPFYAPPMFAQIGAAMAVFIKVKNKKTRAVILPACVSALFGVTEPVMFAINLPLKIPMIAVCVSGSLGGLIVGLSGARATAFAFPSLMTLPAYFGEGFWLFILACAASTVCAFLITLASPMDFERIQQGNE